MYICKCGRSFESKQSYVAHCGHCELNLGRKPIDRFGESRSTKTPARIAARNVASKRFQNLHRDLDIKLRQLKNGSKWINFDSTAYVYLVKFNDKIKVGFTTNLYNRLHKLGNPKLINLLTFPNVESALEFELNFHSIHLDIRINNEYYPVSFLKIFEAQFVTYNQFMI